MALKSGVLTPEVCKQLGVADKLKPLPHWLRVNLRLMIIAKRELQALRKFLEPNPEA